MNALHNFTMVGDAEVQFGQAKGQHGTFALADFAPIFLYRANDNILFEAGFDVTLQNNTDTSGTPNGGSSTSVSMSFGQLDYLLNDYVTVVAGYMVLPLGTYSERAAGSTRFRTTRCRLIFCRAPVREPNCGVRCRSDSRDRCSPTPFMALTGHRRSMPRQTPGRWIWAAMWVTRRT